MANKKVVYDLAINGLDLKANATRIQTHKRNVNSYNNVLRQGSPIGTSSGNAQFWITVELAFPNLDEINNTLRTLIACFKISPFVQLSSSYIAGAAFSDTTLAKSLAGTLSNLSIYTRPGEPRSLYATLDMMLFNHIPYTNALKFKRYSYGSTAKWNPSVTDISESEVYTNHLKNVLKTIPRISNNDFSTQIGYSEFAFADPPTEGDSDGISDEDISDIGKNLFRVNMSNAIFSGAIPKMSRLSSGAFELMTRAYGGRVPISNMFLSVFDIDFYNDEEEALLDEHRAGIAFDLAMYSGDNKAAQYRADPDYLRFAENAANYGFIANPNKPWHFAYSSAETTTQKIKDLVKENHTGITKNASSSAALIELKKSYQQFLTEQKDNGWFPTNIRNIFKKSVTHELQSSEGYDRGTDAVITSLNVAMTNSITSIPMLGHEYPTHQYMGGKHARAIFSAEGRRGGTLDSIKYALNRAHKNGLEFHKIKDASSIMISNPVTKMLGLNNALGDSTESSTVPENPEIDIFVFSLTEHDPYFEESLSQENVLASNQVKERAFSIMRSKRYFKFSPIKALFDPKDSAIPGIVSIVQKTQAFYDEAYHTVGYSRDYSESLPDYNAHLSKAIDRVADILNSIILDQEIDDRYIAEMGDLYGLIDMVSAEISKRKSKTEEDIAEEIANPGPRYGKAIEYFRDAPGYVEPIDYDKIADIYSDLSEVFWDMFRAGVFDLKQFNVIRSDMAKIKKSSLVECYPDLNLPATVSDDPIDTNPNFFYYEDINDGKFTESLVRDIDGYQNDLLKIVSDLEVSPYRMGHSVNDLGFLPADASSDSPVENGESRPKEFGRVDSEKDEDKTAFFDLNQNDTKTSHRYDQAHIKSMMDDMLEQRKNDTGQYSINKAFPTYKIFFIEEDYGEEFDILPRLSFDEFFGYNAVHDIKIIRSRKVPADLCIISMSNSSGKLSDKTQFNNGNLDKFYEDRDAASRNTTQENPIDALLLRPGQRIQVRLGYDNNPENLDIVFNGQIVEVGGGKTIQVVCQSYATELVSQVKGLHKAESIEKADFKVTSGLINYVMQAPEVVHFGNKRKNIFISMLASYEDLEDRSNSLYGPNLNPRDDNIFAPQPHTYMANTALLDPSTWNEYLDVELWEGLKGMAWGAVQWGGTAIALTKNPYVTVSAALAGAGWNADKLIKKYGNLDYKISKTTIWDILKEMELRHPGWVATVVPYGNRMTLFFGTPDMEYWFKPDDLLDSSGVHELDKLKLGDPGIVGSSLSYGRFVPFTRDYTDIQAGRSTFTEFGVSQAEFEKRKALVSHRIKPFREHHYLSDTINIISNDITVNADAYNAVTVQYVEDVIDDVDDETGHVDYDYDNYETVKADADLRDESVNLLFSQQPNCEKKNMARRYALGLLLRHMKDIYGGSITILGNPKIKPYDTCHVFDKITDMYGPVEVEQVVHHFSQETGFITEIVPDLCVSANQYATLPLTQAVSQFLMGYDWMLTGTAALGPAAEIYYRGYKPLKAKIAAGGFEDAFVGRSQELGKWTGNQLRNIKAYGGSIAGEGIAGGTTKVGKDVFDSVTSGSSKTWNALKKKKLTPGFLKILGKGASFIGKGGWLGIGAATLYAASSFYVKKTQLKQPIMIHPLTLNKAPFISGIEGFKQDDLYSAFMDRAYLFKRGTEETYKDLKEFFDDLSR